jgi:hypothetical protein
MATGQHRPAQPMGASHWVTLRLTGRPHVKGFSRLKIKPEINFWCRKNRLKGNKNLEKNLADRRYNLEQLFLLELPPNLHRF